MKKVLGLDLGTNSIGWALVNEAEKKDEASQIIKLGVRVNPLTVDEKTNFEKGRPLSTNADRTLKRGMRRNLQRYKQRRENLIEILIKNGIIQKDTPLTEVGKGTTYQTLSLRAKAARDKIELEDFAKVLLAINKKRGYKSSRKASNDEEGQPIDGMAIAKELYERNITPGQYVLELLEKDKKYIPDFYRSDLKQEFNAIWNNQKAFYPDILTNELYKELEGKNKSQIKAETAKILKNIQDSKDARQRFSAELFVLAPPHSPHGGRHPVRPGGPHQGGRRRPLSVCSTTGPFLGGP